MSWFSLNLNIKFYTSTEMMMQLIRNLSKRWNESWINLIYYLQSWRYKMFPTSSTVNLKPIIYCITDVLIQELNLKPIKYVNNIQCRWPKNHNLTAWIVQAWWPKQFACNLNIFFPRNDDPWWPIINWHISYNCYPWKIRPDNLNLYILRQSTNKSKQTINVILH